MIEREPHLEHWSYQKLTESIITAVLSGEDGIVDYCRLPHTIELIDTENQASNGSFFNKLLECRQATDQAADLNEYGAMIRFDPGTRKIGLQKNLTQGEKNGFRFKFKLQISPHVLQTIAQLPSELRAQYNSQLNILQHLPDAQSIVALLRADTELGRFARQAFMQPIGHIHSHSENTTFSLVADFISILKAPLTKIDLVSLTDGSFHALVTTRETEWITDDIVEQTKQQFDVELKKRLGVDSNNRTKHPLTLIEVERIRANLLKDLTKKFKLGYYQGETNGLLKRVV